MLKKRIIFVLFYKDGYFHLSRNFRLQKVGDVAWLIEKFNFFEIGKFIDELVVLNVSSKKNDTPALEALLLAVNTLMAGIFVPVTIGGGIRSVKEAALFFENGADKVAVNWALLHDSQLVETLVKTYGAQAVVASLDVKRSVASNEWYVFSDGGQTRACELTTALKTVEELNVGELLLTSIDRDGTAEGLDLALYDITAHLMIPVIACGGVGRPDHVVNALMSSNIAAVATGNLFNFIGSGFEELRVGVSKVYEGVRHI